MFRIAVLVLSLLGVGSPALAQSLSDSEARQFIEQQFYSFSHYVPLGLVSVSLQRAFSNVEETCTTKTLDEERYKVVVGLARAGILKVENDEAFERFARGERFSWEQMLEMSNRQVSKKIVISLTEKGRALDVTEKLAPEKKKQGCAAFRTSVTKVDRIVRNEHIKRGVIDHRVVMLTYKSLVEPHFKEAFQGTRIYSADPNKKAIMVLKLDAFSGKWTFLIGDFANEKSDFTSNSVERWLAGNSQ